MMPLSFWSSFSDALISFMSRTMVTNPEGMVAGIAIGAVVVAMFLNVNFRRSRRFLSSGVTIFCCWGSLTLKGCLHTG